MSKQTRIDQFYKSVHKHPSNAASTNKRPVVASPRNKRKSVKTSHNGSSAFTIVNENINQVLEICLDDEDTSDNDLQIISHVPAPENNYAQSKTTLNSSPVRIQVAQSSPGSSPVSSSKKTDSPSRESSNSFSSPYASSYVYAEQSPKANSSFTPRQSNYTYKVQSEQSPKTFVRRKLFGDNVDTSIVEQSIENLNLAKQGAIPLHDFKLEEIYSKGTFAYQYGSIDSRTQKKYELNDIIICDDLNPKTLFTTVFNVFSNPVSCGYFHEDELDFIYSILTLPTDAQRLLAHMIKRRKGWFRKSNIDYPKIAADLRDTFQVLAERSICSFDIKTKDLPAILKLLQVHEIRQLCQKMKIGCKGSKEENVKKLVKLSKTKPLFPGMREPIDTLYDSVFNMLEYCVCVTEKTWDVINKIMTLLLPNENPKNSFAETFDKLCNTYIGKIMYPNISGCIFPAFSNWLHLESYIQAKLVWSATLKCIERKKWDEVRKKGDLAMTNLPKLLKTDSMILRNSALPMHVRRYRPAYVWLKILDASVDSFKKASDKQRVVEILNILLNQDLYLQAYKGKWYNELAVIEKRNIVASASIILQALDDEKLTEDYKVNFIKRANNILKKKAGVDSDTKAAICRALNKNAHHASKYKPASIIVDGTLRPSNKTGNKTVWCIENTAGNQSYGSVETVAFYHYLSQGFPKGLHCEGALPIALFFTLFWEELYDVHIPGAFVTPYSEAPADLFTEQFYQNRKEKIDSKLERVSAYNSEELSSFMDERFQIYRPYKSEMSLISKDDMEIKEIVRCLGTKGVIGICMRLVENFELWKAGFPDLILWNYETEEHKIVEVKGPRDVLSPKQQLWLEYLHQLGLNIELCLVEDNYGLHKFGRNGNIDAEDGRESD